jgi:hypothetical protein
MDKKEFYNDMWNPKLELIQEYKRKTLPTLHKKYMTLKKMSVREYQKMRNAEGQRNLSYKAAKLHLDIERGLYYHDYMNAIKRYRDLRAFLPEIKKNYMPKE